MDSIGSTLTSGNVGASFSPSDLQSATGVDGTTVVDTIVTQWQTNPYAIYNNTATPVGGVVSVHLYAYGSNDSVVNVTFDAPVAVVNVNVSLGTDFSTFACTYWDATAANWSTYGMTVVNYTVDDSGNIVAACASTHLSDFAAQTQASFLHIQLPGLSGFYAILDGFLSGQNLYPSIVIIIAVFMSVCFALIFIRLDKNAKRKLLLTTLQRWHVLAYGEVDAEYVPAIKGDIIRTDAGKVTCLIVSQLFVLVFPLPSARRRSKCTTSSKCWSFTSSSPGGTCYDAIISGYQCSTHHKKNNCS